MLAETAASFHAAQPHSIVGVWTDTNSSDVMLHGYDMPAISRSVDFIALMAYGMTQCACGESMCEVSACNPDAGCRCAKPGANSNLSSVQRFVETYRTRVDASKLIVVWPAYGVQFTCAAGTGGPTCSSPAWYKALSYHASTALLSTVSANGSLIGESTFDPTSSSQFFRWRQPATALSAAVERQVWWDDAHTLGAKSAWAKTVGIRGVGLYQGTGAYPDDMNGSMAAVYSALRDNFLKTEDNALSTEMLPLLRAATAAGAVGAPADTVAAGMPPAKVCTGGVVFAECFGFNASDGTAALQVTSSGPSRVPSSTPLARAAATMAGALTS
jgi:spore germination protein YaaH